MRRRPLTRAVVEEEIFEIRHLIHPLAWNVVHVIFLNRGISKRASETSAWETVIACLRYLDLEFQVLHIHSFFGHSDTTPTLANDSTFVSPLCEMKRNFCAFYLPLWVYVSSFWNNQHSIRISALCFERPLLCLLPKKFLELPPPLHFVENFPSKIKIIRGEEQICIWKCWFFSVRSSIWTHFQECLISFTICRR